MYTTEVYEGFYFLLQIGTWVPYERISLHFLLPVNVSVVKFGYVWVALNSLSL